MKPRFSERVGAVRVEIQIASMNERLRNALWNFIRSILPGARTGPLYEVVHMITVGVLKKPIDDINRRWPAAPRDWLFDQYKNMSWAEVYELLEFVVKNAHGVSVGRYKTEELTPVVNQLLEEEHAAYRFVGGELTPMTNPAEIAEIEAALAKARATGLEGVHEHIKQGLSLLGKRPDPDYRNSIKEGISAVEGVVKLIEGARGGGLHAALEALSVRIELHPSLKAGLENLYGYTSDEGGIRHPILAESNVDETDARFMIVTCSAFVNFLISKAETAGLLKRS